MAGNGKQFVEFQKLTPEQKFEYFYWENEEAKSQRADIRKDMRIMMLIYGLIGGSVPYGVGYVRDAVTANPEIILPYVARFTAWLGGGA